MHPAHTMSQGQVRFAGGSSANFVVGDAANAISVAKGLAPSVASDHPPPDYVRGALAVAALGPGVDPFVSARVGMGYDAEAGLAYTGRTARIDGRWALKGENLAASFGAGASALLSHRAGSTSGDVAYLQLDGLSGWGVDVPVLVGWRSSADAVWWWGGARAGYENLRGSLGYAAPSPGAPEGDQALIGSVSGRRYLAGALTGLAFGFRHLHAAVEMQAGYQDARATLWGVDVSVRGFTLTPAAALLGSF